MPFQTGSDCDDHQRCIGKRPEFLDDLQGMFAFALYDTEKDACLIVRSAWASSHFVYEP